MGFFYCAKSAPTKSSSGHTRQQLSIETLHRMRCNACSLNTARLTSPKMPASGSKRPLVYILGEAPGADEDRVGRQFIGQVGEVLRGLLSQSGFAIASEVRFNNTIRCRPQDNRAPTLTEVECCRGFISEDIVLSRPVVVVGTGSVPLHALKPHREGITAWRGRLTPIRVGRHTCWFFPILHPSYIMRQGHSDDRNPLWHITRLDLQRLRDMLSNGLPTPMVHDASEAVSGIECLVDTKDVLDALDYFSKRPVSSIDLETAATPVSKEFPGSVFKPHAKDTKILSVALACADRTVAFPLLWRGAWAEDELRLVSSKFKKFLLAPTKKIAHNLPFELTWLQYFYGAEILDASKWDDTMALAHVLDERKGMLALGTLTYAEFGIDIKSLGLVNVRNLEAEPLRKVLLYNGVDAKYTFHLREALRSKVQHSGLRTIARHLVRTSSTIARMHNVGIAVDEVKLAKYEAKLTRKVETLKIAIAHSLETRKFRTKTGRALNPDSPKDLGVLLWDIMRRKEVWVIADDGSTKISTDEEILAQIKLPITNQIRALRGASKLLKTYLVGIRKVIFPDGYLHPSVNLMIASTGRLSYSDPNMQNFPKRKAGTKFIRNIIRARPGNVLLAADYGQIEARCIAMASEDDTFITALWDNFDIHMHWAEVLAKRFPRIKDWVVSELKLEDDALWMKALRSEMKNRWVFPLFYGSSPLSCAKSLHIPDELAKRLAAEFWDAFKGVQKWQKRLLQFYLKHGYVETLTGRRRYGPLDRGRVINSPIQGTASDIVVDASNRLAAASYVPLFNVHDDLTFEVAQQSVEMDSKKIARIMCSPSYPFITVPIIIEMESGVRWGQMEKLREWHSNKHFGIERGG